MKLFSQGKLKLPAHMLDLDNASVRLTYAYAGLTLATGNGYGSAGQLLQP